MARPRHTSTPSPHALTVERAARLCRLLRLVGTRDQTRAVATQLGCRVFTAAAGWSQFEAGAAHAATELACGLVAPAALIAGFIWRPRMLARRMKWELVLLLLLLMLSMVPTAGVFRWSFRWLPFFHLVLAICAADVLQGQ